MSPPPGAEPLLMELALGDDSWMACLLEVNGPRPGDSDDTPAPEETAP